MIERIILIFVCLLLAVVFWFLAILVDRWDAQKRKLEGLKLDFQIYMARLDEIEGRIDAHSELFSGVATYDDIEREANSVLSLRNDIGKLGNRVQRLEKEIKNESDSNKGSN